jgi:hypothetical protein
MIERAFDIYISFRVFFHFLFAMLSEDRSAACSAGLKSAGTSPTAVPSVRLDRIQPFSARQVGVVCT